MFLGDEACGLFGQWLGMSVATPALLPQTQPTWSGVEHACPSLCQTYTRQVAGGCEGGTSTGKVTVKCGLNPFRPS